jgi:hypothetical protein
MLLATLATCAPFDGPQSTRTSRGTRTFTEYFPGAYRVTQCDAEARPRKAMTVARIATPTAVEPFVPIAIETPGTKVFLLYGDPAEPKWANIASRYQGHAGASVHSRPDGRSMVDFGRLRELCGSAAALACNWTFTTAGGRIGETDQRYGTGFPWSTRGRPAYYDVESAAAHETGHSIGLKHANSSPYLTMYYQLCAGCTRPRTLARGDVRGRRALY